MRGKKGKKDALKKAVLRKKLTHEQIAAIIGIPKPRFDRIVSRRVKYVFPFEVKRITEFFNLSEEILFPDNKPPDNPQPIKKETMAPACDLATKMEVRAVNISFVCCECGLMMANNHNKTLTCINRGCSRYDQVFKYPELKMDLEEI